VLVGGLIVVTGVAVVIIDPKAMRSATKTMHAAAKTVKTPNS
jgi:Sec-independent protein translocase protein TatA